MLKEVIAHTLEEEVLSSEGDLASWPSWRFAETGWRAGTKKTTGRRGTARYRALRNGTDEPQVASCTDVFAGSSSI
jgi:hypothetical protein